MTSTIAKQLSELSVFFPLHNEEQNVVRLISESMKIFPKIAKVFEIILINDGSTDNTAEIATEMAKNFPEVRLVSQHNLGYGGAVKRGFSEAKYNWVFFSDGDLQFDLSEIVKFIRFTKDYNVVIGYRNSRADGFKRQVLASLLKMWNKLFFNFPVYIKDIDCAFKLINKGVLHDIDPLTSNGAMLTTELLLKISKKGYKIHQIGVNHYARLYGHPTGNSALVIIKAIQETAMLFNMFYTVPLKNILTRRFLVYPIGLKADSIHTRLSYGI